MTLLSWIWRKFDWMFCMYQARDMASRISHTRIDDRLLPEDIAAMVEIKDEWLRRAGVLQK